MLFKRLKMWGILPTILLINSGGAAVQRLTDKIYRDFTDAHDVSFTFERVFYSVNSTVCSINFLKHFTSPSSRNVETDLILSVPLQFVHCVHTLLDLIGSPIKNIRIALNVHTIDCYLDLIPYFNATAGRLLSGIHNVTEVGLEYDEQQPQCKRLSSLKNVLDFSIIKVKLGALVESYGIFHRRMKVAETQVTKQQSAFYHLSLNKASTEETEILAQFAEAWVYDQGNGTRVQIIVPNPGNVTIMNQPKNRRNMVIPSILETEKGIQWYSRTALEALREKFDTILITYAQWNQLALSNISSSDVSTLPNIILDFCQEEQLINWTKVQEILSNPEKALITSKINHLAIPYPTGQSESATTSAEFVEHIAQQNQIQVGFSFQLTGTPRTDLEWGNYLNSLQNKEGTFLIVKVEVAMPNAKSVSSTYDHFVNVILPKLNEVKRIREVIRNQTQNTDVYLYVVNQKWTNKNYQVTVFCNDEVLQVNELYEALLNWAKRNDFLLILKSAFDTPETLDISSWMTVLRPYGSVTIFIAKPQNSKSSKVPFFVMRNYPPNINGWQTQPCIEWWGKNRQLNFTPSFFKNEQLGALINFGIRKNLPISTEEVQTMFQFVFHRFSSGVLLLTNAVETVNSFEAVSEDYIAMLGKNRESSEKMKLYLDYKIDQKEVTQDHISKVYHRFELLTRNPVVSVEGMHFHHAEVIQAEKEGIQHFFHLLTSSNLILNIPVGVRFTRLCVDELLSPVELEAILNKVSYVICPELTVNMEMGNDGVSMNTLGTLFDTQLYIQKMFATIKPELEVIFEVELAVNLNGDDSDKMQRYLKILQTFKEFGAAYGIKYFIVEAFDKMEKSARTSNGWWTFNNFSNLSDMNVYVEKAYEVQGKATWKPLARFVPDTTTTASVPNPQPTLTTLMILTYTGIAVGIFLLILFASLFGIRFIRVKWGNNDENIEMDTAVSPASRLEEHLIEYELALADIQIDYQNVLGSGAYGVVYGGVVKNSRAAIKCPSPSQGCETFKNVLTEIKILCHLGAHRNLVPFLGAYVAELEKGKLFLATKLCSNGSLQSYLRKNKIFPTEIDDVSEAFLELCRFSLEIAMGMEYIVSKNVVHGDLAARNVLLSSDCVCKIGDFGLSRKLYEYEKYMKESQEPLPWKWMAYESLVRMEFTSMSDMWSYGITVWEIFSLGNIPYAGLNWTTKFPDELRNGLRLAPAQFSTGEIHENLLECWNLNASQRPTFSKMIDLFKNLRSKAYVELTPISEI